MQEADSFERVGKEVIWPHLHKCFVFVAFQNCQLFYIALLDVLNASTKKPPVPHAGSSTVSPS